MCLKRKVFNQCILPFLTYGCETWTNSTEMKRKLQITQRAIERQLLNITKRDKKRNEWIRNQTGVKDVTRRIAQRKWKWACHIDRTKDLRWSIEILQWIPRDKKRPRRRPPKRWRDDLDSYAETTWQRKAYNRKFLREMEEAFILQWIENG